MEKKKTTKTKVLELLGKSGSKFLSGQAIADELFVTRAAVWKAIKALEEDGIKIEAVTNKGYRIINTGTLPDKDDIRSFIDIDSEGSQCFGDTPIYIYDSLESTNDTARDYANANPDMEAVFIAKTQTKGRGRRGRDFFSPEGTGMYMTLLICPDTDFTKALNFTCMMAESIVKAIKSVTGIDVSIKWVNDIFYKDRKIAGILTEAVTSVEEGRLTNIIIGAGINLYEPYEGFPDNIKKTAGALFEVMQDDAVREKLYGAIISEFYKSYKLPDKYPFIEGYKSHSMLIGSYVKVLSHKENPGKSSEYAYVYGIDDSCRLLVRYESGREEALFSGEVSVVKY